MKQLIKEANNMADKMLFKAKIDTVKKQAVDWLKGEAEGIPRYKIIAFVAVPVVVALLLF